MVVLTDDILILSQLGLFIETNNFFSKVIQTNFLLRNLNTLKFCYNQQIFHPELEIVLFKLTQ